jgi:hypothetical protein
VDGRDKPGHDGSNGIAPAPPLALARPPLSRAARDGREIGTENGAQAIDIA